MDFTAQICPEFTEIAGNFVLIKSQKCGVLFVMLHGSAAPIEYWRMPSLLGAAGTRAVFCASRWALCHCLITAKAGWTYEPAASDAGMFAGLFLS